jgi:hypothetical protein
LIGNVVTENLECTSDPVVSPATILTSQADDELRDLTSDGRPTSIEAVLGAMELVSNQLAKLGKDCVWLDGRSH